MSMSRKDYRVLASAFNALVKGHATQEDDAFGKGMSAGIDNAIQHVANVLYREYPNFNRQVFVDACNEGMDK